MISGFNKQNVWKYGLYDYFFSHFGGIWGWASWKRAWSYSDLEMRDIDEFIKQNNFQNLLGKKLGRIRQDMIYNSIIVNKMDTWDYQWAYARHKNSGLACVPSVSLIENIGFGDDATHTLGRNPDNVKRHEISFPLRENPFVVPDREYDELFFSHNYNFYSILLSIKNFIKRLFV